MNLLEWEGKDLFERYGIPVPARKVVTDRTRKLPFAAPVMVKSQVPVGDRKKKGGIELVSGQGEFTRAVKTLFRTEIDGHTPDRLLVESCIDAKHERYVSISYDTVRRCPVLALNRRGGTGIAKASLTPIDPAFGLAPYRVREALVRAQMPFSSGLMRTIHALWKLFVNEHALLAEINPLFELRDGSYIAGDAKVILDDNAVRPDFRSYVELDGDIAVIASGGGASMINLDALMNAGGKPANYVEYSGNPKSGVVTELTERVLSRTDLKGCWVVGGTANFTDIYETLSGFIEGLRNVSPKPSYPIVIRRDGPRQKEAFEMVRRVSEEEGWDIHAFGPETSMADSARIMVDLAYKT